MLLEKFSSNEKSAQNQAPSTSLQEHEVVRKGLLEIMSENGFSTFRFLEESKVGGLFRADFYIPEVRLIIEINGVQHFYPYTRKPTQYTQFKTKLLRGNQKTCSEAKGTYNLLNLNTHILEGLKRSPDNLKVFL